MACLRSLIFLVTVFQVISGKGVTEWCLYEDKFLYTYSAGSHAYSTLESAKVGCLERDDCMGITQEPQNGGRYTLRQDMRLRASPSGERTYVACGGYFSCEKIGLKSVHGTFLSPQTDGSVDWDRSVYRTWEAIKFEQFGKDTFFLKSAHGKYLAATPDNKLEWDRTEARQWELFKATQYEDKISLKSIHGKYLSAQEDGTVDVDRSNSWSWEWFTVHPQECLNNIECDCSKSMDTDNYDLESVEYQVEEASVHEYPPETVAYQRIDNSDGTTEQNSRFMVSETLSESTSFTHTTGASVKVGTEFSSGVPLLAEGKVSVEVSLSYDFSYGTERVEESTTEAEYNCNAPAGKKVTCSALLFRYQSSVPYKQTWAHKRIPCSCESSGVFSQIAAHEMQLVIDEE